MAGEPGRAFRFVACNQLETGGDTCSLKVGSDSFLFVIKRRTTLWNDIGGDEQGSEWHTVECLFVGGTFAIAWWEGHVADNVAGNNGWLSGSTIFKLDIDGVNDPGFRFDKGVSMGKSC